MESNAAVDVCRRNVVDFFQSHTGFFISVRSSCAGHCEHIGSLGNNQLLFGKRGKTETFLFECFRCFVFVELSAITHDNRGTKTGKENFLDTILCFESQTGSAGDASSLAANLDDVDGGSVGSGDLFLGSCWGSVNGKHRGKGKTHGCKSKCRC